MWKIKLSDGTALVAASCLWPSLKELWPCKGIAVMKRINENRTLIFKNMNFGIKYLIQDKEYLQKKELSRFK